MGKLGRPPVLLDIVEEHFDELDFLWEHREANVFTPDWTLQHLAEHEERAEAHLDGLRLAELHGIDLSRARLGSGTPWAAIAATLVLCEGESEHVEVIATALRDGDPPVLDGIRRALRHGGSALLKPVLRQLLDHEDPLRAAAAADALAFQREPVASLEALLATTVAPACTYALAAAGRLCQLRPQDVQRALEHAEPAVRQTALDAAAKTGLRELANFCRAAASRQTDPDPVAVAMLGTLGDAKDEPLLQKALRRPELAKVAVGALGAMGCIDSIPLLLELMTDKALGVAATAAYRRITGATQIEGERPFPPAPVAEGEDEQEELPPDPKKAAADWRRRSGTMSKDRAWQGGVAIVDGQLPSAFDTLPLATRRDVYLRLRSKSRNIPDLELEALARRQQPR